MKRGKKDRRVDKYKKYGSIGLICKHFTEVISVVQLSLYAESIRFPTHVIKI